MGTEEPEDELMFTTNQIQGQFRPESVGVRNRPISGAAETPWYGWGQYKGTVQP